MPIELRHLRYFVAVAEEENISHAARRLNVSQPPLSRQIRDLEDELGVPLLKRSARNFQLTEAGQVFLSEAKAALQRVEDAVALTRAVAHRSTSCIRVGHSSASSIEAIPRMLCAFQQVRPQAKIELRTLTTQEMVRGLHRGELDLCVSVCGDSEDLRGFVVEKVGAYHPLVAAPKQHAFAQLSSVPVQDIARQSVITVIRSSYPWYNAYVAGLLSQHNESFEFAEEHEHSQSVIAAVEAGRGVAIIYDVMARIMADRVAVRPITPSPPPAPLVLFYRAESKSALMEAFIQAGKVMEGTP